MELLNPVASSEAEYFPLHARAATQEGVSFYDDPDCLGTSYRWTLEGDDLTFAVVDRDPCGDSWDTLTEGPGTGSIDPARHEWRALMILSGPLGILR